MTIDTEVANAFQAGCAGEAEQGLFSSTVWEAYQVGAYLRAQDHGDHALLLRHRGSTYTVGFAAGNWAYRVTYGKKGAFAVKLVG